MDGQRSALSAQAFKWAASTTPTTRKRSPTKERDEQSSSSKPAVDPAAPCRISAQAMKWAAGATVDNSSNSSDECVPQAREADTSVAARELAARQRGERPCDLWQPLSRAVETRRNETTIVDLGNSTSFSYADVAARAQRVGTWLRDAQGGAIRPGARVGLMTPNCACAIEAHFAIVGWAQAVALNCNPRLSPDETAYVLGGSNAEILISDACYGDLVAASVVLAPLSLRAILWADCRTTTKTMPPSLLHTGISMQYEYDAIAAGKRGHRAGLNGNNKNLPDAKDDDGAEMYYTSGTSGRPKGVVLSRRNVVLHALGCVVEHRLNSEDVWLHAAPMFHLVDAYAIFAITWVGGKHITLPQFNSVAVADAIADHRVTVSNVASTMITLLLADPHTASADLTSLELLSCGGAPLSQKTVRAAIRRFDCEFFLSYGMTECCGKISMSLLDPSIRATLDSATLLDLVCTSGRRFSLMQVRVVTSRKNDDGGGGIPEDEDDAIDIAPSSSSSRVGEVWIRGPTLFAGYHNNDKATAEAITPSGWFRTGDLATLNEYNYLTITDRAKDMILVGSENVYCVEVERVLHDHPAIKHACVYGLPDEALGERVKACVVLKPRESLTVAAIRKHAAAHLADFKVPTLVDVVEKLPMTGSGKVAKAQLKKLDLERIEKRRANKAQSSLKRLTTQPAMADHVYGIEWHASALPCADDDKSNGSSSWLIVCNAATEDLALLVAKRLGELSSTSLVRLQDDATVEKSRITLEAALAEAGDTVLAGVVACCDTDRVPLGAGANAVSDATHVVLRQLLALLQAVSSTRPLQRVVVATRGAATVCGVGALSPIGGAVVGACRSARAECPRLRLKSVDLCPNESVLAMDADVLCREARSAGEESAWRRRSRYAPSLVKQEGSLPGSFVVDSELASGTHVVTGGTGGLGVEWAARLARAGGSSTRLVLASRRAPSKEVQARVDALVAETKASIVVERADISDPIQATALITRSAAPLMSIWHLAGVVDDGTASKLTWERFSKVLAPKITGSLALYDAAVAHRAKRLVFFSSIYGLLGSRELVHYAAANAFQDSLAAAADNSCTRVQAVSWGTWADAGMAHRFGPGFEAQIKATGMHFVQLDGGFEALASAAKRNSPHVAVLPADWSVYSKHRRRQGLQPHALAQRLVESLSSSTSSSECPEAEVPKVAAASSSLSSLVVQIRRSTQPIRVLEKWVLDTVAELLDDPTCSPDPESPVSSTGMTSVHIVDLASRLADALDTEVSPTIVFECVTIRAVCTRLAGELCADGDGCSESARAEEQRSIPAEESGLRQRLVDKVAELIGSTQVDVDAPVVSLGLSSMHIVELATFLADLLDDDDISPTLFFEHVTIRAVCVALAEEHQAPTGAAVQFSATASPPPSLTIHEAPKSDDAMRKTISISGMACRLPGDVALPEELWRDVLLAGQDCVWDEPPLDRPHNGRPSAYVQSAVLTGFDRLAFGVSAAEASSMDPQQRLLLECCAESLERSGRRSTPAAPGQGSSSVGVFAAIETSDYAFLHQRHAHEGSAKVDAYCGTGWHGCVGPNRVSYLMDLRGPSASVNTACSSSLTCVSVARHSLLAEECEAALVCGANLQLQPYWSQAFAAAGMLSPTNRCRFGDDAADGYVRGEGVGVVLIEITTEATRHASCEIAGVGVGQDGRSNGMTAPNPVAQIAVVGSAYDSANSKAAVAMLEAHGTGTKLGDPIELGALGECRLGSSSEYLRCASIKSNLGHLEGSSGLAGLLKAALCLSNAATHNRAPRSLHFNTPNVHVAWEKLRVAVVNSDDERLIQKESSSVAPAIVGVSSFGFGGALGHVALRQVRRIRQDRLEGNGLTTAVSALQQKHREVTVVPLAAHSDGAMRATAKRWASWVSTSMQVETIAEAATERVDASDPKARPFRAAVAVSPSGGSTELCARLEELSNATETAYEEAAKTLKKSPIQPRVAFAFTGQGAAYPGMGRQLYEALPSFKAAYDDCASKLGRHMDRARLDAAVFGGEADDDSLLLEDASVSQPALFATEYALAKAVLATLGLERPTAVVGHSLGEIAAAAVANVLSLASAAELVCARGAAMSTLEKAGVGGMVAIRASAQVVQEALRGAHCFETGDVQIAADNSNMGCTVSGTDAALEAALKLLEKYKTKRLEVITGFHSICVEPCLPAIRRAALKLPLQPLSNDCSLYSTLFAEKLESPPDANYWCAQARGEVKFAGAVRAMLSQHRSAPLLVVEIGPSPHLLPHLADLCTLAPAPCAACATLKGPKHCGKELAAFSTLVSTMVSSGALKLDSPGDATPKLALPPTAFVSSAPSWFSQHIVPTKKSSRKLHAQGAAKQLISVTGPDSTTFSAKWVQTTPTTTATKWPHVLLLTDRDERARHLAVWLRSAGSLVTVLPTSAASSAVAQSWDAVVFAAGLGTSPTTVAKQNVLGAPRRPRKDERTPLLVGRGHVSSRSVDQYTNGDQSNYSLGSETVADLQTALRSVLTAVASKAPRRFVVVARAPDACPTRSAASGALIGLARSARREAELLASKVAVKIVELHQAEVLSKLPEQLVSRLEENDDVRVEGSVSNPAAAYSLRVRRLAVVSAGREADAKRKAERVVKDGVIAVTGGTGALGLITAKYLVQRGATSVLLLSRSGRCRPADEPLMQSLRTAAQGRAQLEVIRLDVGDMQAVDKFVASRGLQLTGLVHAAGTTNDGVLSSRTSQTLTDAMRPKVYGALRLTSGLDDVRRSKGLGVLSLELYFSSTTALLGNAGQTDYGAANAALDALVASRRAPANRPRATAIASIQWGPWAGHGMAAHAKGAAAGSEQAPYVPLDPTVAERRLDDAIFLAASPLTLEYDQAIAIVNFDWHALGKAAHASPHMHRFVSNVLAPVAPAPQVTVVRQRQASSSAHHQRDVEAEVVRVVRSHLSRDDNVPLGAATPLAMLALDSLEVMAVVRDLNAATGAELSVVDILSAATLGDLIAACPKRIVPDYEEEEEEDEEYDEYTSSSSDDEDSGRRHKSTEEVRDDVVRVVSKHTRDAGQDVGASTTLASLALDSLEMMAIVRDINAETGAELSVVDVLEALSLNDVITRAAESHSLRVAGSATCRVDRDDPHQKNFVRPGDNDAPAKKGAFATDTYQSSSLPYGGSSIDSKKNEPTAACDSHFHGEIVDIEKGLASSAIADELKEPSIAYRLYFTILSFMLGTQIILWGTVPLAWVEAVAPLRFKLRPKLSLIEAFQGFRSCEWLEIMLPPCSERYPGIPASWAGQGGELSPDDVPWTPTWCWSARFCGELCATLVWYLFIWSIGCHVALIVAKWLVVGRYRPGAFPIWESSVGWRSALFINAVSCSFYKNWSAPVNWLPSPLVACFLRLLGAKIGKRVSFSMCPIPDFVGFDLLSVGDDAVFNSGCRVHPVCLTSTCVITHGHVRVGNRAKIGVVAELRHGAHVSDDAVVCAGAGTMGFVQPGAYALSGNVVVPARRGVPPAGAVDTKIRVATEHYGEQYVLYSLLPIISYLTLLPVCVWTGVFAVTAVMRVVSFKPVPLVGLALLHLALILGSICVVPWSVLIVARTMRFAAYGPHGALGLGREVRLTRGFVLAHSLVDGWAQLADTMFTTFFLYSGGMNWIWRSLGMRVGSDVILSEQIANHGLMDLVDIGAGSYLAARTAILASDVDIARGVVKLKRVSIGKNCFIGPLSVIMPGAVVEDAGATGSCAVVGENTRASSGRICIGDGDKTLTLAWRPSPLDAFAGRDRLWNIYSTVVFFAQNFFIKIVTIVPSWCLLLAGLELARERAWAPRVMSTDIAEIADIVSPTMHAWLVVADVLQRSVFILVLFTVALHGVVPFRGLVHVAVKWLLMGATKDDGVAFPLRGRKHIAWCMTIQVGRMPALPKVMRFMWEYVNAYATALGAKIGRTARLYPEPEITQAFPEADVVEIGEDVKFSAHMYGHDFSSMNLKFKTTTAASGVNASDAWQTQVLPGSHLPPGTTFKNVGRSVVFAGLCTEPNRVWSGNPVRPVA